MSSEENLINKESSSKNEVSRDDLVEQFEEVKKRKRIGDFKVDKQEKLYKIKETKEEVYDIFISRNTPFVTRKLRDIENGQVYYTIKYKYEGKDIYKDVKASTLVTRRDLMPLSDDGLAVNENNAKEMINFIDMYLNEHELPQEDMTTRIGFIGNKFIHPQDKNVNIIQSSGYQSLIDSFKPKGSLESYRKAVFERINNEHTALFFMLATLASPLLKRHEIDPFIVDLSGRTSAGKTTLLRLCASIWGDRDLIGEWNITKVALERKAAFLNNFPLLLDDTRKASPYVLQDAVYNFSGGRTKGRGNIKAIDEELTWHNILISTGEVAITEYSAEMAGAAARVISIDDSPFVHRNDYKDLYTAMSDNYGTLGVAFMREYHSDKKYYDNLFDTLETQYFNEAKGNDVLTRLGRAYAIIHLAGEILLNVPGFEFDLTEVMQQNYRAVADGSNTSYDKPKELMINLLEKLDSEDKHIKYDDESDDDRDQMYALWKSDGLYIPVKIVKDFLDVENKQTRKQWMDKEFTQKYHSGDSVVDSVSVPYKKTRKRFIKIHDHIIKRFGFDFSKSY